MSRLQEGANDEKQEKGGAHKGMLRPIDWEGSVLGERDGRGWSKVRGCEEGQGGGKVCVWILRL